MTTKTPVKVISELVGGCKVIVANCQGAVAGAKSTAPEKKREVAESLSKGAELAQSLVNSMRQLHNAFPSLPSAFFKALTLANSLTDDTQLLVSLFNAHISDPTGTPVTAIESQHKKVSGVIRELLLSVQAWNASQNQQADDKKHPLITDLCSALGKKMKELYAAASSGDASALQSASTAAFLLFDCVVAWAREAGLKEEEALLQGARQNLLNEVNARSHGESEDQKLLHEIKKSVEALAALSEKVKSSQIDIVRQQQISSVVCTENILPLVPVKHRETITKAPVLEAKEDPKLKRERMRANALRELLDSETLYFTQLKTLIMQFISPLEKSGHKIMQNRTIADQFTDITTIDALTKKVLTELKNILAASTSGNQEVGEVFVFMAPVFKLYMRYINNYEKFNMEFLECKKKFSDVDEKARKFCEFTSQNDISFYFILPIQRLPRYEMLLAAICKFTDEDHPDYANLSNALKEVKKVNDWINEKKREEETRMKMFEVERALTGSKGKVELPNLTNRMLIRTGNVIDATSRTKKKIVLYMLNDLLLVASIKKPPHTQATLTDAIPLSRCTIRSAKDVKENFEIVQLVSNMTKPKVHCFACISESERNSWVQAVTDAININVLMDEVDEQPEGMSEGLDRLAAIRGSQTLPRGYKAVGPRTRTNSTGSPGASIASSPPPNSPLSNSASGILNSTTTTTSTPTTPSTPPLNFSTSSPSLVSGQPPSSPTTTPTTAPSPGGNMKMKFASALTLRPHNKTTVQNYQDGTGNQPARLHSPSSRQKKATASELFPSNKPSNSN